MTFFLPFRFSCFVVLVGAGGMLVTSKASSDKLKATIRARGTALPDLAPGNLLADETDKG